VDGAARSGARAKTPRSEAGDTLIEVLLAIVVLGMASVALLVAFATTISGSAEHRSLATMDTVLRSAAEEAISQIQQQSNSQFGQCNLPAVNFSLPAGYQATIESVEYWDSATSSFASAQTACVVSTPASPQVNSPQLIQLTVTYSSGTSMSLSFVVDDPSARPVPVAAAATHLVFLTSPGNSAVGTAFATQPVVAVEDANGNIVTSDFSAVTLNITTNTGFAGATLSNNCAGIEFEGVVTFSGCSINLAGSQYTLTATDGSLTSATSGAFNITGVATRLVFTTQPVGGVEEGTAFATEPVVSVEDSGGNVVTTDNGSVALSIGTYSAGNGGSTQGTLGCTNTTVNAVAGVATFANCQITGTAGAGTYSFNAARSGLTTGSSSNLSITAGAATQLVFTTQPVGGANGVNFATQPVVTTEDANSNVVTTSSAAVTLAIATQPGTGAALTCTTNPLTPTNGVATFAGCQIAGKTGSYTLSATISGPITVNSSSLSITVGAASKLVFTTQPVGGVKEGTNFGTEPVVTVEDSGGNTVTTDTGTVALSIGSYGAANGGSTQGTLGCTNTTVSAVAGVATFASCQITGTAGAGTYSLNAARSGLSTGSSNNVSIVGGTATKLVFSTEPVGGVNEGTNFATQPVVSVEDANSNVVTTDTGTVALSIGVYSAGNGGTTKGTLGCTNTTVSAVAGVATFANCQITGTAGAGTYSFNAARSGLTTGSSSNLSITVGPASTVAITPSPTSATASSTTNVTLSLQIEDAFGNTTTSSGTTTLTLSSPSTTDFFASTLGGTGSLNNTINVTFANGVGTATTYYGDEKAETPTITAKNSGGTTWGTTSALTVTAGTAAGLSFTNVTIDSGTAAAVSCTGTVGTSSFACTISPNSANGVGNSITASVVIIDQFQNPVVNSFGTTITVNLSATGGSITPTSVTIPNGSSTSTSTFKESLNTNSGAGVITSSVSGIGNEAQITDR
jgi:type II secretory pathway pseudopilin PulG